MVSRAAKKREWIVGNRTGEGDVTTLNTNKVGSIVYALERIEILDDDSYVVTETAEHNDTKIVFAFDDQTEAEAVYAGFVGAAAIRNRSRHL